MMRIKPEQPLRDAMILLVVVVGCALAGWFGAREFVGENWQIVGAVVGVFSAQALLKLITPSHAMLRRFSWPYMLVTMALGLAAVVLASDWSLLGAWTLPTVALLFVSIWVVRAAIGPRKGSSDANVHDGAGER